MLPTTSNCRFARATATFSRRSPPEALSGPKLRINRPRRSMPRAQVAACRRRLESAGVKSLIAELDQGRMLAAVADAQVTLGQVADRRLQEVLRLQQRLLTEGPLLGRGLRHRFLLGVALVG